MAEKHKGGGQNAAREIEREIETRSGHPTSEPGRQQDAGANRANEETADELLGVSPRSHQHARKGQAESPREMNLNQPERKQDKNR